MATDEVETAEPDPELDVLSDDERARPHGLWGSRSSSVRTLSGGTARDSRGSVASITRFRAVLAVGHGKPVLDFGALGIDFSGDGLASLRFNLSHSAELALIGVCRGHELGVDLE